MYEVSNFSTSFSTLVIVCFIYFIHPGSYEVVSHCGFDLHFPSDNDVEHLFMCLLTISISAFNEPQSHRFGSTYNPGIFSKVLLTEKCEMMSW